MKEIKLKEIVENLIDTFLKAGQISLELRKKGLTTEMKSDNTPVTNGDLEVEQNALREFEPITAENITLVGRGSRSLSVNGNNITEAIFDLNNLDTSWFRVSIIDKFGGFAWLNPVWL